MTLRRNGLRPFAVGELQDGVRGRELAEAALHFAVAP